MSLSVPLAVRLKTARADRHVTRDLRTLRFGTQVPGGFTDLAATLDRALRFAPDEIAEYADVYVYDRRSAAVVWQGRLEDPGRGAGADGEIWELAALGPAARAHDREVPLVYVDRSLERWSTYSASNRHHGGTAEATENTDEEPVIRFVAPKGQVWKQNDHVAMRYRAIRAAGMKLARLAYTRDAGVTDSDWRMRATVRQGNGAGTNVEDDGFSTTAAAESAVVTTDWSGGEDIAELKMLQNNAVSQTVANDDYWAMFSGIVVTALRMTKAGVEITSAGSYGSTVTAQDVIEDLLGRLLTMYDGGNAVIATTATYAIEQLAYPDTITPGRLLEELMQLNRDHWWAAWEDGPTAGKSRFEWTRWATSARYETTAQDGFTSPASAGELYNAVRVRYRDPRGRILTNRRTQTVAALTAAGLTREKVLDLGDDVASSANADRAGDQFLAEHAAAPNAGALIVRRRVLDRVRARMVDPWELRAGALIRVRDVDPRTDRLNPAGRDGTTIFRIVSTEYDANENTCTLGLDSPARTLAQLVGRRPPTRRR